MKQHGQRDEKKEVYVTKHTALHSDKYNKLTLTLQVKRTNKIEQEARKVRRKQIYGLYSNF